MEYKDYYAALGVPRGASQDDVKKQFRKLARQHHPDVNKGDAAAEARFKEISEAYDVLGDAEKRKAYDALGANWEAYQRAQAARASGGRGSGPFPGGAGTPGGPGAFRYEPRGRPEDLGGYSEFFRTFFGRGGTAGSRAGGRGTRTVDDEQFDDLLSRLGGLDVDDLGQASGGRTARPRPQRQSVEAETEVSLEQAFTGTLRLVQVDDKRFEVKIPAGVEQGQRIKLTGKAAAGTGDIVLRVTIPDHPVFTRSGADLHRELPLTLAEALLGAEVPVETLGGRVMLRIPPETQNGRVFRLGAQGMPRLKGDGRGDLYVKARVVLPAGLDDEARHRFEAFAETVRQPDPRRQGARTETRT